MKQLLCFTLTVCLALLVSGSCASLGSVGPYSVKASIICFYEDGSTQQASTVKEYEKGRLGRKEINELILLLTKDLSEGFTDARMTSEVFDGLGESMYRDIYYIDSNLKWEKR